MNNRIALGTVQFGIDYGVANQRGQVNNIEVSKILEYANHQGLDTLDTAVEYGESEQCLGHVGVDGWRVITKLPGLPGSCINISDWLSNQVQESLSRLNIPRLAGLLVHRRGELTRENGRQLWAGMQKLKQDGLVDKIGISICEPSELDALWPTFHPDLVQAPLNLLDQRLITSGWLQRLYEMGTEVHVRSVFLQGLLLMDKASRPKKFDHWSELWDFWDRWLDKEGVSALQACLAFSISDPRVSGVVVGVDSLYQLQEILSSVDTHVPKFPKEFNIDDTRLINPFNWGSL